MADAKLERCEADDPNRCQAVVANGQCPYKAVPGFKHCKMHHGQEVNQANRAKKHQYRLGKWQARMEEFENHDQVRSLRSEIGITKLVLEELMQKCESGHDLLLHSSKISELVSKIEKLVPLMIKIEEHAGITLDKNAILQLADVIVGLISTYIDDPDAQALLADQIIGAIVDAQPIKKDD